MYPELRAFERWHARQSFTPEQQPIADSCLRHVYALKRNTGTALQSVARSAAPDFAKLEMHMCQ